MKLLERVSSMLLLQVVLLLKLPPEHLEERAFRTQSHIKCCILSTRPGLLASRPHDKWTSEIPPHPAILKIWEPYRACFLTILRDQGTSRNNSCRIHCARRHFSSLRVHGRGTLRTQQSESRHRSYRLMYPLVQLNQNTKIFRAQILLRSFPYYLEA